MRKSIYDPVGQNDGQEDIFHANMVKWKLEDAN